MLFLMTTLTALSALSLFLLSRRIIQAMQKKAYEGIMRVENNYQDLFLQKEEILARKSGLEKQAADIFTLYEMTKEITEQPNEEEAFEIFKIKFHENVTTEDCQYVSMKNEEFSETSVKNQYPEHFIFTLKEKNRKLGYIAFKGLNESDKDKAMILGHQFALALRRVKFYQEIEQLATTDSLTGAHTRRYFLGRFDEELKRAISRKIELSLLMIDVDNFKAFNDKYGHLVGDQILRSVGDILKHNIREIDVLGRYGGEEFSVVLPDTDRDGAQFAAERIRSAVEKAAIKAYDTQVKVTASIGISTFPADGKETAEMIDKADWALYRAKKQGRNCICAFGVYQ